MSITDPFGISKNLLVNTEDRRRHLNSILTLIQDKNRWELHSWLHQNLIILDDKANSTLAVNSIILAAFTIFYATLNAHSPLVIKIGTFIGIVMVTWSMMALTRIVFVFWSTTEDFDNPDEMINNLLKIRDVRTKIVRGSIVKSVIAFGIFAVILTYNVLSFLVPN